MLANVKRCQNVLKSVKTACKSGLGILRIVMKYGLW